MKMIPIDVNDIPEIGSLYYKQTKNHKLLTDFLESGLDCVELVDHDYNSANSAYTSLTRSMQRFGIHGIRIIVRKDRVFLVRDHYTQK